MKTFETFKDKNEQEKLFLELAHLDDLEIKFDFIKFENLLFYYYKELCLFALALDNINKNIYINSNEIWDKFENNMHYDDVFNFMKIMMNKYFHLYNFIISPLQLNPMRIFENSQYNIDDEAEQLFLNLAHLDELEIRFDFINNKYQLLYLYKDIYLFSQDKHIKYFRIKHDKIWSKIEIKFHNFNDVVSFMNKMAEKYFNLYGYMSINVNYINFE